ncbi:hypothetical protein MMC10_010499 [Thelotrema lepadinum]|nr:hypothetical protein [Thelotrema lepadinum]
MAKMADSMDRVVQKIVEDDRPIALRKKRRRSTVSNSDKPRSNEGASSFDQTPKAPQTPGKVKKRVRFSDPGPEILSPSSTGITPFVQKTTLQSPSVVVEVTQPKRTPRRWASLPSISAPLHQLSSPIEIQFEPLRQILTPRRKRQLGRTGLSEEMNNIEAEKKIRFKQQQEIEELRDELEVLRQQQNDDIGPSSPEDSARAQQLENEIRDIKEEMHNHTSTISEGDLGADQDDAISLVGDGIYEDPDCVLVDPTLQSPADPLPPSSLFSHKTNQASQTDAGVPSSIPELEDHIKTQTAHLLQARLNLERLYPGETALPLTPPADADCSPLLAAMLDCLRASQTAVQSTKSSLRAAQTQEANVRAQFNGVLTNLDTTREAHAQLLKGAKAGAEKYAQARERIVSLEAELDEGSRSSEKLKTALNSYREEVKSLEALVTRVEREGNDKLEAVNYEKDEAVADLECWVAAETRGRREAEEQLDARALQIRTLEGTQSELKKAISEKQTLIRGLEDELDQVKRANEDEVGKLNVKIGNIEEALTSARADKKKLENEKASLSKTVADGKQRELKKVSSLKEELRKAVKGVEVVVGGWEQDASRKGEGVEVGGLLTPRVESGRFRDMAMDTVGGTIEMKRGKSRRSRKIDSGIGMLEEDVEGEE